MVAGLAGPRDVVLIDADSHASIYDACRLSRNGRALPAQRPGRPRPPARPPRRRGRLQAGHRRGPLQHARRHGAPARVRRGEEETRRLAPGRRGALVRRVRPRGRGVAEAQGVETEVDFVVGTFSKAWAPSAGSAPPITRTSTFLHGSARGPFCHRVAQPREHRLGPRRAAADRAGPEPARAAVGQRAPPARGADRAGAGALLAAEPGHRRRPLPDEVSAARAWNLLREHGVYVNLALPPGTPNSCAARARFGGPHGSSRSTKSCPDRMSSARSAWSPPA